MIRLLRQPIRRVTKWHGRHRRAADRRGLRYPSALANAECAIAQPMIRKRCSEAVLAERGRISAAWLAPNTMA